MKALRTLFYITLTSGFILTGCGGGGGSSATTYSGSTTQATINDTNAQDLSKTAADGTSAAKATEGSSSATNFLKPNQKLSSLSSKTASIANDTLGGLPMMATQSVPCDSGSMSVSGSQTSATITFNNCLEATSNITFNGSMTYSGAADGSTFTASITNFTITDNTTGQSETLENMTMECTNFGSSCTFSSDFTGSDGRVYRVSNFSVSGDDNTGYTISGRVYDPDHGYVDITTNANIFYNCTGSPQPSAGTITITGNGTTATVEFMDCNQYRVTFNGTPTIYNW